MKAILILIAWIVAGLALLAAGACIKMASDIDREEERDGQSLLHLRGVSDGHRQDDM